MDANFWRKEENFLQEYIFSKKECTRLMKIFFILLKISNIIGFKKKGKT